MLAACGSRSLVLEASGPWSMFHGSVFRICDIRHAPVPACAAISAFIILKSSRTGAVSGTYSTGPGPALHWWLVDHMA